ncbi:PQQ-binding-like beta-propeller repeat protein [Spiroplasma endosymbiont of Agriotes lineatus]|uniref:PQQ-binding-like beta-propeller repeat protein n=1 Tax=Spiroplasma endosymbiont of Agriotes lineatus TaxID=3077930 RepID=UPI0030CAAF6D
MKKLLEILGTITIAGTGMSGIVGNAPTQTKNEINFLQTNNLENINYKRQKWSNNENNKINIVKTVINTNGIVRSDGIIFNSKVYFGSWDHNVYEYDPLTGQQKVVIRANGEIWTSGVMLNNKLYFGSDDHKVYEYDPLTGKQKVVIEAIDNALGVVNNIRSSGVVLNNKLYFGCSNSRVYEYDPATGQQKVVIQAREWIDSAGVVLNNKLYIGSADKNVYEYDPVTEQQKVVITASSVIYSSGIVLNNKLYFGSWDHNVYEYDPLTGQQKVVIRANGEIWTSGVMLNNKLYFGSDDHKVYEYDPLTGKQKVVIEAIDNALGVVNNIRSSGVVLNNKLYFGCSNSRVYEYDPATGQQKVVIQARGWIDSAGVVLNNKLYIGSADKNVYEYSWYYLNSDLDISQQNKIINLNELIQEAIFFKFQDENPNLKFKEIKNIDTNNLTFSNVEVTRKENSFLWSNVPKNVCSDREIINKTPNTRSFNVPACEYNLKSKLVFQITTGLTKTKQENKLNGWNINSDDEMKLTDFTNINNKNSEIINVLSNEFDLSNTNKQEQEMILSIFKEPVDKFELNPNEKLQINYFVRIVKSGITLNLKQKINGTISAKIIDDNNKEQIITLSITEVMQILQKYSLLPNEIAIDKNNDKITFNGGAFFSSEREGPVRTNTVTTIV